MWGNLSLLHGKSLSPAWKEPERRLTDNEVEVAWERAGEFQGKNIPVGFMGLLICQGSGSGRRWGCTPCTALGHLQKSATTSRHQQVQVALLSGHARNDRVWEMLFWPVQHQQKLEQEQEQPRIRHSCCCAEPAERTAVYFWEVNLGLWETSMSFERRIFSLSLPLEGETMAFSKLLLLLVAQRPLS